MAYLQSNQPYQRVDDGRGMGIFSGALLGGGAAAGGMTYATSKALKKHTGAGIRENLSNISGKMRSEGFDMNQKEAGIEFSKRFNNLSKEAVKDGKILKHLQGPLRSWGAVGGAALLGGIVGGFMDNPNK